MTRFEIKSESDLLSWLNTNQDLLKNKVIRLHGDMGAGKTTLVRLYLSLIAPENENVSSPTFALHHQYQTNIGKIDHLDLYRLEDREALDESGFWEILNDSKTIFIEWPSRVPENLWPKNKQYTDLFLQLKQSSDSKESTRFLSWLSL